MAYFEKIGALLSTNGVKGLKAFKKIAEATSLNKLYINSYLYNF